VDIDLGVNSYAWSDPGVNSYAWWCCPVDIDLGVNSYAWSDLSVNSYAWSFGHGVKVATLYIARVLMFYRGYFFPRVIRNYAVEPNRIDVRPHLMCVHIVFIYKLSGCFIWYFLFSFDGILLSNRYPYRFDDQPWRRAVDNFIWFDWLIDLILIDWLIWFWLIDWFDSFFVVSFSDWTSSRCSLLFLSPIKRRQDARCCFFLRLNVVKTFVVVACFLSSEWSSSTHCTRVYTGVYYVV